jgi:hypothetical protein
MMMIFPNICQSPRRLLGLFCSSLLGFIFCSFSGVQAASIIPLKSTVAVLDFSGTEGKRCADVVRQELVRSQAYNVWPNWYTHQKLDGIAPDDWQALLIQAPEINSLILGSVLNETERVSVTLIVANTKPEPTLVLAETVKDKNTELENVCRNLAAQILGSETQSQLQSPGLSASLSLIMPGAGHFYQGKPLNILLGTGFLTGYLALAYLGFSAREESMLSRQQWGGLLLLLSLTDILSAYFLSLAAEPGPQ